MSTERPLRVLFVDDEPATCRIGALHLEKAGYAVEVAANGAEAFVAAMGTPPDIVITDIMMPVMDGVELLGKIRQEKALRDCYVILLTSKDRVRDVVEGFAAEADDYVTKPFQLTELLARVQAGARVKRIQDELRVTNERLRGSLRQLAEVIGVAAHEMRGPLHVIASYANLIGGESLPPERIRAVCTEHASALSRILEGLLDLSRIDMGQIRLCVEEVRIAQAVKETAQIYAPVAAEKLVVLEGEADPEATVFCDRRRITEMLGILAESALLLSHEGSGVRLRGRIAGEEAVFDAVLGRAAVTAGEVRALFALSLREESVAVTPGLQVGFAILHKLAALHDGRVLLESLPAGGGFTIGFALPRPTDDTPDAARRRAHGEEPALETETA